MMPAIDPRYDARKKRARVAMIIMAGAIVVSSVLGGTRFSGWQWEPWMLALSLIIIFCAISLNSGGGLRTCSGRSRPPGAARRSVATCCPDPGWRR